MSKHPPDPQSTAMQALRDDPPGETLSAAHAARELGVSRRTLYAYVSRGLLASIADPRNPRARRYPVAGVQRLAAFRAARRDPALGARAAARGALAWGEPILESAITQITDGRLYYRGHDALALAEKAAAAPVPGGWFERVTELLWRGVLPGVQAPGAAPRWLHPVLASLSQAPGTLDAATPVQAARALLPLAEALDAAGGDLDPASVARVGRDVIALVSTLACGGPFTGQDGETDGRADASVAARIAASWSGGRSTREAAGVIDAALVLVADHELNVSAFAARVVASAGASPYAAIAAGFAALEGARHGGETSSVTALLGEAESLVEDAQAGRATAERLRAHVTRQLRQQGRIPGFGHRLYPDGDPRAALLLRLLRERWGGPGGSPALAAADALAAEVHAIDGSRPSVDFALATLCRVIGAPPSAPLALFAVGRTAGLVAHALEQYRSDRLLRPRARYVGPPPLDPVTPGPRKRNV
ncbi:MAG TPA: citrate synthase [Longimicrobium sp.]|nr:citrate synthase [Longimicrobium sp.]